MPSTLAHEEDERECGVCKCVVMTVFSACQRPEPLDIRHIMSHVPSTMATFPRAYVHTPILSGVLDSQ